MAKQNAVADEFTTKFRIFIVYAVEFAIAKFLGVDAYAAGTFRLIGQTLCGLEAFWQVFIGRIVHRTIEITVAQPFIRYALLGVPAFVLVVLTLHCLAIGFV